MNIVALAQQILFKRRGSYRRVFDKGNRDVVAVLHDLQQFCRANTTTFHADPRISAALEGRREVWLRLQHHIQLSEDEIWTLYRKNDNA